MESKRAIAIIIILIALAIIVIAGYNLSSSYVWTKNGRTIEEHTRMIDDLKKEEDLSKKEEKVKFLLESKSITQAEAEEILKK